MSALEDDPFIGQLLSKRYKILQRLGEGGMGTVYLAQHLLMQTKIAIKVLHPDLSTHQEVVARFQREAQATYAIGHPNICGATDFGRAKNGGFFLVMEYLDGQPLDDVLVQERRVEIPRALHIMFQICNALEAAHGRGVIHRDLKPENIMLIERDGVEDFVKLMDFGVASIQTADAQSSVRLTRAGMAYGTPAYMSPEQVIGEDVDQRADLYTLGVILYEMLTGDLPYEGDTVQKTMGLHLHAPIPNLRDKCPEAPEELEQIVTKLLQKELADRFSSAANLRAALMSCAEPVGVPQISAAAASMEIPIFTATPTQGLPRVRLDPVVIEDTIQGTTEAIPARRSKWWAGVAALIAVGAFAAGAVALNNNQSLQPPAQTVATVIEPAPAPKKEPPKDISKVLATERAAFVEQAGLPGILEDMARGAGSEAISKLEGKLETHASSAHLHFYLGVAYLSQRKYKNASAAFGRTIELDERYTQDAKLLDEVAGELSSKRRERRKHARKLIESHLQETFFPIATDLAINHRWRSVRNESLKILKSTGGLDRLSHWQHLALELRAAHGCKGHLEVVNKIDGLGATELLPHLKRVERLPRKGCGMFKRHDCYSCLRDPLRSVISRMEKRVDLEEIDPAQ